VIDDSDGELAKAPWIADVVATTADTEGVALVTPTAGVDFVPPWTPPEDAA
jgi:hypothetical protein